MQGIPSFSIWSESLLQGEPLFRGQNERIKLAGEAGATNESSAFYQSERSAFMDLDGLEEKTISGQKTIVKKATDDPLMSLEELKTVTDFSIKGLNSLSATEIIHSQLVEAITDLEYLKPISPPPNLKAVADSTAPNSFAREKALAAAADWFFDVFTKGLAAALDDNVDGSPSTEPIAGTNYGLLMGGGTLIENLVGRFLADIRLPVGPDAIFGTNDDGTARSREEAVTDKLDRVAELDTPVHNRLHDPSDKSTLEVLAIMPIGLTDAHAIRACFTTLDGVRHDTTDVPVGQGFFRKSILMFTIPPGVRGQTASLTIEQMNPEPFDELARDPAVNVLARIGAQVAGFADDFRSLLSPFMVLDNIKLTGPSQQTGSETGVGEDVITLEEARAMAETAAGLRAESGLISGTEFWLDGLTVERADLEGAQLASVENGTITLDPDAAGLGWFVDPTPREQSDFAPTGADHVYLATSGLAGGRYDLLTVLLHEIDGQAMGLEDHAVSTAGVWLMTEVLKPGMQPAALWSRYPGLERGRTDPARTARAAIPHGSRGTGVLHLLLAGTGARVLRHPASDRTGGFVTPLTDPDARWETTGDVRWQSEAAAVAEATATMSGLSQTFALPDLATGLQFTLSDITLAALPGFAPDAFEGALFDARTGASPLGGLTGMSGTDAFLNLQSDGTIFVADSVTAERQPGGTILVTVDLSGLAVRPDALRLSCHLIGMGDIDSSVTVDNGGLPGLPGLPGLAVLAVNAPPVAMDDEYDLLEDTVLEFDRLANDSDPEDDGLFLASVSGSATGTLEPLAGGLWRYTPEAETSGIVTCTNVASDGQNQSAPATVTLDIAPVTMRRSCSPCRTRR